MGYDSVLHWITGWDGMRNYLWPLEKSWARCADGLTIARDVAGVVVMTDQLLWDNIIIQIAENFDFRIPALSQCPAEVWKWRCAAFLSNRLTYAENDDERLRGFDVDVLLRECRGIERSLYSRYERLIMICKGVV